MKLLRWAAAGASAYVVYKYSIGKKAKGEDVFQSPDADLVEAKAKKVSPTKASTKKDAPAAKKAPADKEPADQEPADQEKGS